MKSYTSFYKPLVLLGMPFVIGQLGSIVLAFADTALSMWVIIGGNILNFFGNWILIYAKFGLTTAGLLYLIVLRKRLNYIEREP